MRKLQSKKRIGICINLICAIILSLLSPLTIKAASDESDVYYVSTAEDLINIAREVNAGKTFENETICLNADIDLEGVNWIPIGNSAHPFKGSMKAVGAEKRVISNLSVRSVEYGGFIGYLDATTTSDISNIMLENVNVSATYAGGLAGYARCTSKLNIKNCSVSGSVEGKGCTGTGGLVGTLRTIKSSETNILQCKNDSNVYSFGDGSCSGGLIGICWGTSDNSGAVNMEMCCNLGKVSAEATYSYCTTAAGGLIGDLRTDIIKIEQCFNEGTIYSKAYYDYVGGFIGTMNRNLTTDFLMTDSYVNATIKGICTNGYSQGGGLIGHLTGDNFIRAEIIRCYAAGNLDVRNKAGFICWQENASRETSIRDCRYNREQFGLQDKQFACSLSWFSIDWYTSQLVDSYSLTSAQMSNKENFNNWDFTQVWALSENRNSAFPYLRWYYDEIPVDYSEYELHIYSQVSSGNIGVGQTINFAPVLSNDTQRLDTKEEDFTIEIQNPDIVELYETEPNEGLILYKLLGVKEGTTEVTFTHFSSQKSQTIKITVLAKQKIYDIANLFKDNVIYNNHLFVDNFSSVRNVDGSYHISFDIYNEMAFFGAVEVHDADGKIIQVEKIDRFESYPSSLKEVLLDSTGKLLSDCFSWISGAFEFGSYKAQTVTKRTPSIEAEVPDGGYIVITNDVTESVCCYLLNKIDTCFWSYSKTKDVIKDISGYMKEEDLDLIVEKGQKRVIQRFLATMTSVESQKEFSDTYQKKIASVLGKSILEQMENFTLYMLTDEQFLEAFEIDCKELFVETAVESGFGMVQDAVEKLGGAAGLWLKAILEIEDYAGRFIQEYQMSAHADTSSIRIEIEGGDDALVSEDVIVENVEGRSIASESLIVTDKTSQENLSYYVEKLSGMNNQSIRVLDITMYADDKEVQPEGRIKVKIPLPQGWNQSECKVFREEKNGDFTDMNAVYEDGYIVFVTSHLSTYVLLETGDVDDGGNTTGAGSEPGNSGTVTLPVVQKPEGEQVTSTDGESGVNESADDSKIENILIQIKGLSLKTLSKRIAAGKKVILEVQSDSGNVTNQSVKWMSSNKKYATVNKNGVVTTKKAGAGKYVIITAMSTDGSGIKATVKLQIMKDAVTKVKISMPKKNLEMGKSIQLTANVLTTGKDSNKALKWSCSNTKYATVDQKGKVKAKKAGRGKTVTITAMATDGTAKKSSVKLKIK